MRIPLRAWLEDQPVSEEARSLFAESFRCYEIGAYRAALLFSYLGIMRIVAQRLLVARPPDGYDQPRWVAIQRNIRDEARWEQATFDALMAQRAPIFLLDEDLRDQLRYWRGRRNDSAHWKGTAISAAHVESLWSFAMTHLPKLVVAGGASSLLLQFQRHFDPQYTTPKADVSHLVGEIEASVRPSEYSEFMGKVLAITSADEEGGYGYYEPLPEASAALLKSLLDLNKPLLIEALISRLLEDEELFVNSLLSDPRLITRVPNDPHLVRRLWFQLLPFGMTPHAMDNWRSYLAFDVLLTMLRTEMIPRDEWPEVVDHIVSNLDEGEPRSGPHSALLDPADPFGFIGAIHRHAFQLPGVEFAANNLLLACNYLDRFPVDVHVARTFTELIPKRVPHRPDDHDYYWMDYVRLAIPEDYARLVGHFASNPAKYNEIVRVARENGLSFEPFAEAMKPEAR